MKEREKEGGKRVRKGIQIKKAKKKFDPSSTSFLLSRLPAAAFPSNDAVPMRDVGRENLEFTKRKTSPREASFKGCLKKNPDG